MESITDISSRVLREFKHVMYLLSRMWAVANKSDSNQNMERYEKWRAKAIELSNSLDLPVGLSIWSAAEEGYLYTHFDLEGFADHVLELSREPQDLEYTGIGDAHKLYDTLAEVSGWARAVRRFNHILYHAITKTKVSRRSKKRKKTCDVCSYPLTHVIKSSINSKHVPLCLCTISRMTQYEVDEFIDMCVRGDGVPRDYVLLKAAYNRISNGRKI